jgi:hypothetical protein
MAPYNFPKEEEPYFYIGDKQYKVIKSTYLKGKKFANGIEFIKFCNSEELKKLNKT